MLAGVFVGVDNFAIGPLTSEVLLIRIDEELVGRHRSARLATLVARHPSTPRLWRIHSPDVVESVVRMPDLPRIALVDGELDLASLEPLKSMKQLDSLEIRYIRLPPEIVDASQHCRCESR